MQKKCGSWTRWLGLGFWVASAGVVQAADPASGLDLTMEVVGKTERMDDRLVNRIPLPGSLGAARSAPAPRPPAAAPKAPVLGGLIPPPPTPQEYQQWVEQYREAQAERRADNWERYQQWKEQHRRP